MIARTVLLPRVESRENTCFFLLMSKISGLFSSDRNIAISSASLLTCMVSISGKRHRLPGVLKFWT